MKSWIFLKIKKYKKTSFLIFLFLAFLVASEIFRYLNLKEIEAMTVADVSKVKTYQVFWGNPSNMALLIDVPAAITDRVVDNAGDEGKPDMLMITVPKNIVDAIIQKDWQKVLRLMKQEVNSRTGDEKKYPVTIYFYNDGGVLYKRATDSSVDNPNYNLYSALRENAIRVNDGVFIQHKYAGPELVLWDMAYKNGARTEVRFRGELIKNSLFENQENLINYAENLFSTFNPRIVDLSTGQIHGK